MQEGTRGWEVEPLCVQEQRGLTGRYAAAEALSAMVLELARKDAAPERPLPPRDLPPLLSFFTGAGFLDLGVMRAGFPIVWSLEKENRFADAHDHGMQSHFDALGLSGNTPSVTCRDDIAKTKPRSIKRQAFGLTGPLDGVGIIGGPPCPDFSIGGKNRGFKAERGRLTHIFVERILGLSPSFFLIENVKGLVSTNKHRQFLHDELARLERSGYRVDLQVLNALNLGVPQDRERVFVVGMRRELTKDLYGVTLRMGERGWFPWPADPKYEAAKTRYQWPTTDPFGSSPPLPSGVLLELCAGPLIMNQDEIEGLPNGTEGFEAYSEKFKYIPEGDDSRKSFKRLHRWRYSPTVAYGNNEVHLHPALPRRLRVREALRLQTVPDTFALPPELPLSAKFKLIGNGVPVQMAERVASCLAAFLTGENPPRLRRVQAAP